MSDGGGRPADTRAHRTLDDPRRRFFGDERSREMWRWQLVLAFSTVTVATVITLLDPGMFLRLDLITGLTLIIAITLATMIIPWSKVPRRMLIAVPFLDILSIGFLGYSSDMRLGFLWVFPIAWIATYYAIGWLVAAVCTVGLILLFSALLTGITATGTLRIFTLTILVSFIGVTILLGTNRTRASIRLMRRQSRQLERMLERAQHDEQRQATLLDTLQTGVAQVEPDGTIRTSNAAYRRLYGLDSVPQLHPARAVEYRERRGAVVPADQTVVARAARGETFAGERVWLFDATGRWRALEVAARYRRDGMIIVVDDVTAATEVAQERSSLARVVSHELRGPLTAVLGHAELLLDRRDLPEPARQQVAVIENSAERMEEMIARILQDRGRDPAECDTIVELREIVRASVQGFRPAAAAREVSLDLATDDAAPLLGDGFRLRQVADNLLGNAVKYTPRGGRVEVRVEATATTATLTVSDTGIGISADDLPRVFDRYFRAESARDSGIPGTGLGMGIVREIVDQHGGRLELSSEPARGTTVTVRLPRHPEKEIAR